MGIKVISDIEKKARDIAKKEDFKKRKKQGRPALYEDFLSEPITQKEYDRYQAAIKMGDIEHKLKVRGYPKPKGPKSKVKNKAKGGLIGDKFVASFYNG